MRLNQIFEGLLREASMKANANDRQKILDALDNVRSNSKKHSALTWSVGHDTDLLMM
jgi:hypothetical protein